MYQVTVLDGRGRQTSVDLHNLYLADGTKAFAHLHDPATLYRKLKAMGTPQIENTMGSIDLMLALARYQKSQKIDQITGKTPLEAA